MSVLKSLLQPNIFEKIDKAGIATPRQILVLSVWDIKKVTNFSTDDVMYIKNIVCHYLLSQTQFLDKSLKIQNVKLTTGCINIDNLLRGGFSTGTITEVYGESGSGKTQLAIMIALNICPKKCVYICTEDLFPVKRLNQIRHSPHEGCDNNLGNNIFVEHLTEPHELMSCIRVRLPKLLEQTGVSLVVIDSIAAPFRCESVNYVKRAEDLRETAIMLITLAQKFNLAVICINQVTAAFEGTSSILPSLGLAWSNMVTYRLLLKKMTNDFNLCNPRLFSKNTESLQCNWVRELKVIFAPNLPNSSAKFSITSDGLQSIS